MRVSSQHRLRKPRAARIARIIHDRPAAAADLAVISGVLGVRRLRRIAVDTTRRLTPASARPDSHLHGFVTVFHELLGLGWVVPVALAFTAALATLPCAHPIFAQPQHTDGSLSPAGSSAQPRSPEGDADGRFRKAGEAYEAGRFAEAVSIYDSLRKEGYDDPRVYYNLGNAWFKQGRLGPANLSYERALARDPSDADAKENLAYANLLITDKVGSPEEDWPAAVLSAFERRIGPDRALALLAGFSALAGLAALPLWFRPAPTVRKSLKTVLSVLLPLAGLALAAALVGIARPGRAEYAIVLADSADGRSAPASDGTVLFTVHEGLKVELRGEREGWVQIGLPNGLTGWIEAARAERI